MKIEPFRIFFGVALVAWVAQAWITNPWMAVSFFYAALTAWLWNLAPLWFQAPLPKITELFPVVMLLLFMMVLGATPARPTSEALFYTAAALVLLRGLLHLLVRIRNFKNPPPTMAKAALFALLLEMGLNAVRVYSTFRPVSESILTATRFVSIKGMMLILTWGWWMDSGIEKRERGFGGLLILGCVGNIYLAGAGLIANTILFLKGRGFRYQNDSGA